jgi:hypothetical protein
VQASVAEERRSATDHPGSLAAADVSRDAGRHVRAVAILFEVDKVE